MTTELEDQLREAYAELPPSDGDAAELLARVRCVGRAQRRRRRVAAAGGGLLTTGVIASAAAVIVTGLPGGAATPAAPGTSLSATRTVPPATPSPAGSSTVPGAVDLSDLFQGKRIAGVGDYLLPHGSQLPAGLEYQGAHNKLYDTSQSNASTNSVFLSSGRWSCCATSRTCRSRTSRAFSASARVRCGRAATGH